MIRNQTGFILIDSLFAITVVTVALFAIIGLINMGTKSYVVNNEQSKAYQIAASFADGLQTVSIANWAMQVTSADYQPLDISKSVFSNCLANARTSLANFPGATVAVSGKISPAENSGDRLAQVKIVVSWNNNKKSVQLVKYYIRDIIP